MILVGPVASDADMEAASSLTKSVPPGRSHRAPSALKAAIAFNGNGTVGTLYGYNVDTPGDNAVGDYTVSPTTDFSSANYAGVGICRHAATDTAVVVIASAAAPTASAFRIRTVNPASGSYVDPELIEMMFAGDQ